MCLLLDITALRQSEGNFVFNRASSKSDKKRQKRRMHKDGTYQQSVRNLRHLINFYASNIVKMLVCSFSFLVY